MDPHAGLTLPEPVGIALSLLERHGFEAYVVGGCTRDALLGETPEDWDITTSALPEQTLEVFSEYRTIETGLQHGTVTVRIDQMNLEVTTYRVDGEYTDARHPETVAFTRSLKEDLARRDFTMNAIAYSPTRGYVDLYEGQADIDHHIIRCVGDSEQRFQEDALRILRALRFSSVLGFSIEAETAAAIHRLKDHINYVANERIATEFLKLLCGKNVFDVLMEYRDVFAVILPELTPCFDFNQHNPWHCYDVYTHIAHTVEAVPPDPALRLTMLLHDIGKPETFLLGGNNIGHFYRHAHVGAQMAEDIVQRLRLSSAMQTEVTTLVEYHEYPLEPDRKVLRRCLNKFGKTTLQRLLLVQRADNIAKTPELAAERLDTLGTIEHMLDLLLQEKPAFRISDLEIDGNDLLALGMPPGPAVGKLLNEVLEEVLAERLPNDRFLLLEYVAGKVL